MTPNLKLQEAIEICNSIKDEFRTEKDLHTGKLMYSTPAVFSFEKDYGRAFNILISAAQSILDKEEQETLPTPEDFKLTKPSGEVTKIARTTNNEILAITYEGKQYYPKEVHPAISREIEPKITFDKSALKDLCKMQGIPYDERIIGFTKWGVIVDPKTLSGGVFMGEINWDDITQDIAPMLDLNIHGHINHPDPKKRKTVVSRMGKECSEKVAHGIVAYLKEVIKAKTGEAKQMTVERLEQIIAFNVPIEFIQVVEPFKRAEAYKNLATALFEAVYGGEYEKNNSL